MSAYLTAQQIDQLLKPINGKRVGKDGKGFSHVEAYDIRAHLTRIFGPARWSDQVTRLDVIFESSQELQKKDKKTGRPYGDPYTAWTVCYSATVAVTVCAPDGTVLASYEDGATGEATNQPARGDAHDLAMKTALSQAFKRAAVNLGDQFGLSLYNKGSLSSLVMQTLIRESVEKAADDVSGGDPTPIEDVTAHITDQLAREDEEPETTSETRERNGNTTTPDMSNVNAAAIYARLLAGPDSPSVDQQKWVGGLLREASAAKCLAATVDTDAGPMVLKTLLEQAMTVRNAA